MVGEHIEHYRILAHLGDGGMGTVFRALDTMLEREVALKVLRTDLSDQPDVTKRFRAEAVTLARLSHPHIATLFGLVRHGSQLCMVMEFVPGETLATLMRRETALPWERAVRFAVQILGALDYAHGSGIIHRDIKPSNVVVSATGVVKVLDFGIARVLDADRLTRQGFILGTPQYMAPEQIRAADLDGRADVYSVGVLLYEMLAGRLPFQADNEIALMYAHLEGRVVPLAEAAPSTPPWLFDVVGRALAKTPEERFPSAAAFRDALETQWRRPDASAAAAMPATGVSLDAPTVVPGLAVEPSPMPPPTMTHPSQAGVSGGAARFGRLRAWLMPRVTWEYYAGPDGMLTVRRALRPGSGIRPRPEVAPVSSERQASAVTPRALTVASADIVGADGESRWRVWPVVGGIVAIAAFAAATIWLRRVEPVERSLPSRSVAAAAASSTPPLAPPPSAAAPDRSPSPADAGSAPSVPVEPPATASPGRPATPVSSPKPSKAVVPAGTDVTATPPSGANEPRRDGTSAAPATPVATPSEAAASSRRMPPANLPDEKFEDVSLLVPGRRGGFDDVDVTITFERDRLIVFDTDEDRVVAAILYTGDGTSSSVTGPATLLVGSDRWFLVPTSTGRIVLQLDEDTAGRVVSAFETRTGLSVTRSRGELAR